MTQISSHTVLGCFEIASIPSLGIHNVQAKVDTGAFSGAIHCTDIRVVRRGPDKKRVLKFIPNGQNKHAMEFDQFLETYVRSATGHRVKRFIVDTEIELKGNRYPIRIGLSDRSDMKRSILIGRRFLRENNMLVDVRINQELDDEGKNSL